MQRRVRIQPARIIGQLQSELDRRQAELDAEQRRNLRARLKVALLKALDAAGAAMRARGLLPPPRGALAGAEAPDCVDAAVAELAAVLWSASNTASAAGGGSSVDATHTGGSGRPAARGAEEASDTLASAGAAGGAGWGAAPPRPDAAAAPGAPSASGDAAAGPGPAVGSADAGGSADPRGDSVDAGGGAGAGGNSADDMDVGGGGANSGGSQGASGSGSGGSKVSTQTAARLDGGPPESVDADSVVGAVGTSTSAFLDSSLAVMEAGDTREEFVAWWREAIFDMVMLLRQSTDDEGAREQLVRKLHEMGAKTIGLVLGHLWFFSVFNTDLATNEAAEAPMRIWKRTAAGMRLSPEQDILFDLVSQWWFGHSGTLALRREELSQMAIDKPDDVALQAEIAAELEYMLVLYKAHLVPVMVLINTVFLRPEQMAEYYVQPWPWMPVLTSTMIGLDRLRAGETVEGPEILVHVTQQRTLSCHTCSTTTEGVGKPGDDGADEVDSAVSSRVRGGSRGDAAGEASQ